jgi:hypothetical protein
MRKARPYGHALRVLWDVGVGVVAERRGRVDYEKHAQAGRVSRRKVNGHVRHAHMGVPYVLWGMWEVEVFAGSGNEGVGHGCCGLGSC